MAKGRHGCRNGESSHFKLVVKGDSGQGTIFFETSSLQKLHTSCNKATSSLLSFLFILCVFYNMFLDLIHFTIPSYLTHSPAGPPIKENLIEKGGSGREMKMSSWELQCDIF